MRCSWRSPTVYIGSSSAKTYTEIPLKDRSLPNGFPSSTLNLHQFCSSGIEVILIASPDGPSCQQHLLANTKQPITINQQIENASLISSTQNIITSWRAQAPWNGVSDFKHENSPPTPFPQITSAVQRMKTWEVTMKLTNFSFQVYSRITETLTISHLSM